MDDLFAFAYTFMDDLLVFDATFMDELVSLSGEQGVCFTKAIRPFFVFHVEIYATNTKKTRKKDEENTKDTRNFAYFSSKQRTNHRAKTAR